MISTEQWRASVGSWASRINQKFKSNKQIPIKFLCTHCGFNIYIINNLSLIIISLIIYVLLIRGGIEINPGPTGNNNKNNELEQAVPTDFCFAESTTNIHFNAPIDTRTLIPSQNRHVCTKKKRSKIFTGVQRYEKNVTSNTPIVNSQSSIIQEFDDLEMSTKGAKVNNQSTTEVVSLTFDTPHQISNEIKPILTTSQGKIFPCDTPLAQTEVIDVYNDKHPSGKSLNFIKPSGTFLMDLDLLEVALAEVAICKFCIKGRLYFRHTIYANGLAKHMHIICDQCHSSSDFYNLPKKSDSDDVSMFPHNTLQILGGRLAGIGKSGIDMLNSIIGLPPTLAKESFYKVQTYLSTISTEYAKNSCHRASQELRESHQVPESDNLRVSVSYDGAYQKRGHFSRYCFASAISVESGKVLSFEIACNGCKYCVEKQQALKDKRISIDEYNNWKKGHADSCQAKEYGNYNSVALESQLAPVIFSRSVDDKVIYETVIADGDDKSVNLLEERNVYGQYGVKIRREECLSHVQKRVRTHLVEKQKEYIASNKTLMQHELASCTTEIEKKTVKEKYRPLTVRDLKFGSRDKWDEANDVSTSVRSNEINLLPDSLIDKIVSLYGFVIKSNGEASLDDVRSRLIAIINHLSANENNCQEMHARCQPGVSSFCRYQSAIAKNTPIPKHPRCLSVECRARVLSILEPYTNTNFLSKVIGGRTSNLNESLHGLIWNVVSKTSAIDIGLMKLGASIAVIRFNEGVSGIVKFVESVSFPCFSTFVRYSSEIDKYRISASVRLKEYTKRRWSIKFSKRCRKRIGTGYKSGAFSAAVNIGNDSDKCHICGGDEQSGVLIGRKNVNIIVDDWCECSICCCWFHVFCLNYHGVNTSQLLEDDIFICPICDKS